MTEVLDPVQLLQKSKRIHPVGQKGSCLSSISTLEQLFEDARTRVQENASNPAMNLNDSPILHHPAAQRLERSMNLFQCVSSSISAPSNISKSVAVADWSEPNTAISDYFRNKYSNTTSRILDDAIDESNKYYAASAHLNLFSLWKKQRSEDTSSNQVPRIVTQHF